MKYPSGLLCCVLLLPFSVTGQTLRIYHIDVDQADATLFVAPNGQTLLVDSGKNGHGDRLRAVLANAGVSQIDVFVNTHYHEDHYSGVDELLEAPRILILEAYDRGDKAFLPATKLQSTRFLEYDSSIGQDAIHIKRGDTIPLDPSMTVTCISSGGVVVGEADPTTGADENDMSVSLLIAFGGFRYFIGGDIEQHTEAKIAERDLVRDVHIYQANHHGSHTSSSDAFMRDLAPQTIIISNGNHGGFMHPRQVTLDLYATLPGPPNVFQTNKYLKGGKGGNVPDRFIADLVPDGPEGTILVTVDAAAGNYTVTYGSASHSFPFSGAVTAASVVIESLLPNPRGNDRKLEAVTIRNAGGTPTALTGWRLEDRSGGTWSLTGQDPLGPGKSRTILRDGMKMTLNNSGDRIMLIDAGNVVRDEFEYSGSEEGLSIPTFH